MWSTNPLERINKEIKRRSRVVEPLRDLTEPVPDLARQAPPPPIGAALPKRQGEMRFTELSRVRTHRSQSMDGRYRWYNNYRLTSGGTVTVRLHGTDEDTKRLAVMVSRLGLVLPYARWIMSFLFYECATSGVKIGHVRGGTMRFSRAVPATILVVVALFGSTLAAAATAAPQGAKPAASDVGITDTEIHLAVIADVDNAAVPGLFQAAVDTMRAWAKYVNKQGGVAGRNIVIDFYDSKLSPNEARDAVIKACSDDFAMVGGEALFLNNVDDLVACKDAQGNAVGIPDMPGLALDTAERCSPVTFIASGDTAYCATKDQHPQTYTSQVGDALYYLKKNKDLHGVFTIPADLQATKNAMTAYFEAMVDVGLKRDGEGFFNTSAMAPQSTLTPIVQTVKNNSSNFVYNGNAPGTMVLLRREAKLQGANSVKVWACNQGCYDAEFLKQGGGDVEGTYSVITSLPFYTEYKSNPTLKAVAKSIGGADKMTANSIASLVGAVMFQEAAEKAVANGGTLNRQSLLDALRSIGAFDAQGLIGPTEVGNHKPPGCIVITQVKNGKWARVFPKKSGTFDCNKDNLHEIKLDLS